MEICKTDLVLSLSGHDQGKLFYVLDVQGDYAWIVDGKGRKLENPKRKKLKHVRRISRTDTQVTQKLVSGDQVLNSELRRDMAIQGRHFNSQNQGG